MTPVECKILAGDSRAVKISKTLSIAMCILKQTSVNINTHYNTIILPFINEFSQIVNDASSREDILNAIALVYGIDFVDDNSVFAVLDNPAILTQMLFDMSFYKILY